MKLCCIIFVLSAANVGCQQHTDIRLNASFIEYQEGARLAARDVSNARYKRVSNESVYNGGIF